MVPTSCTSSELGLGGRKECKHTVGPEASGRGWFCCVSVQREADVSQARDTRGTTYISAQQTSAGFINNMCEQSTPVWLRKYSPNKQFVPSQFIYTIGQLPHFYTPKKNVLWIHDCSHLLDCCA